MNGSLRLWGAPLALLLLAAAGARADQIPVYSPWTFSWTPKADAVLSDGGQGGVSFTKVTSTGSGVGGVINGSSDIVATNLKIFSAAPANMPETFNGAGAYTLSLLLTDKDSGQSATLTFNGKLGGQFSASSAHVTNTYGPGAEQTVTLGDNTYTVTLPANAYTAPQPPSAPEDNRGGIGAHVEVTTATVQTAHAPEPSTLLLSGMGLSFLGTASWRRRRRDRVAVA
jgi:hypothetical protein